MPEHRAKAVGSCRLHPRDKCIVSRAFARPRSVLELFNPAQDRGWIGKRCALGQPLAHTRGADTARDDTHRHVFLFRDGIRERWNKTAPAATCPRLWIICNTPCFPVECRDISRSRCLFFFAVIGRVRLACDDKHLADSHMRHCAQCELFAPVYDLNLQFPPTTRRRVKRSDDLPALHRVHLHP